MTEQEIKLNLEKAIDRLFVNDFYLIQNAAHERSITHMLARHLVNLFPDYDIDCEYNLDITNLKGRYAKRKEIQVLIDELENIKKNKRFS